MIEIYEGRIGAGKTYFAVRAMLRYLAHGGHVCSNVELNWPESVQYCRDRFGVEIEPDQYQFLRDEQISMFHRHTPKGTPESPVLTVIDEAHIWLNARKWASASEEFLAFLTQSRKHYSDIVFITQAATNVDKQIRSLVQFIWRFRDFQKVQIAGVQMRALKFFLAVQFDYDGKTVVSRQCVPKDTGIYKSYTTTQLLRTFERGGQVDKKTLKKVRRMNTGKIVIGAFCAFATVGGYWVYHHYSQKQSGFKTIPVAAATNTTIHPKQLEPKSNQNEQDLICLKREIASLRSDLERDRREKKDKENEIRIVAGYEGPSGWKVSDEQGRTYQKGSQLPDGSSVIAISDSILVTSSGKKYVW